MRASSPRPGPRRAIGVVELLVAVAISAMLAALLIPAVFASREAVRLTFCTNRLRQFGLAFHEYAAAHGALPPGKPASSPNGNIARFSPQSMLLPYLDYQAVYDTINFSSAVYPPLGRITPEQLRARQIRIPVFECPADELIAPAHPFHSFRVCRGKYPAIVPGTAGMASAPFTWASCRPLRDFVDGLGKTSFMSERLTGDSDESRYHPARDVWRSTAIEFPDALPGRPIASFVPIRRCRCMTHSAGLSWIEATLLTSAYNHVVGPNDAIPDCGAAYSYDDTGVLGARSPHTQGVNVLWGDGSVRFMERNVDLQIWQAAATIAGMEPGNP